ncbi:MAG: T9SS type A sorting domain-containing protein, partial [Bacteroidales bacterium]|nr:T9SS type A sorting domain-containing protein [Bacteroidales bacterium]
LRTISFNFRGASVEAASVEAIAHNKTQVNVQWRPFGNTEVMLVYSASGTFGTPSGNYSVGQTISGGGTVLYVGNSSEYSHTGLSAGGTYRYKLFTKLDNSPTWSSGLTCSATTPTCNTASFPYSFNFSSTTLPACWVRESTNNSVRWEIGSGNGGSQPSSAYSAPYNAYCKITNTDLIGNQAFLISEPIDLSGVSEANLKFVYCNTRYTSYLDMLTVVYRSSYGDPWSPLATFNKNVPNWTEVALNLPNLSDYYQIAFIATVNMGRGICVDDIELRLGSVDELPATPTDPRITMYPNPAKNAVTFSIEGNDSHIDYVVFDLTGKALLKGNMEGAQKKTISTERLKSGMYFVRFQNDSFQKTETLIIR